MNTKEKRLKHEQEYVAFLERRVKSKNFKKNASLSEYEEAEKSSKKPSSSCGSCKRNKRIIETISENKDGWCGYDTNHNPYGKVVIKDKRGKVVALQG